MEFNEKIKALRLEANATLEDIGNFVGVSKATVQRWESGDIKNIRRDKIAKLAKALHTTPAYLMDWADEIPVDIPVISALMEFCTRFGKDKEKIIRFYQEYPASLENLRRGNAPKAIDDLILRPTLGMSIRDACSAVDMPLIQSDHLPPEAKNIFPLPSFTKRPRLGTIACGKPILCVECAEEFDDVPDYIECDFTLRCQGDSMINSRIFDGDIVYIRSQPQVENGEIAAVRVGEEATLKKVYYTPGSSRVTLRASNPLYPDMEFEGPDLENIEILGKAVAFTSTIR